MRRYDEADISILVQQGESISLQYTTPSAILH